MSLGSAAAEQLMAQAALTASDLRDCADRADAGFRLARRRVVKALVASAAGVHPDIVRIGRSPSGAPIVTAPDGWFVSVAGQGDQCLIGLAREPIGVDIEPCTAPPPPLDLMSAGERQRLASLCAPEFEREALLFWVAKEAHAKRTGRASHMEPDEIEITRTSSGLSAASKGEISRCWAVPWKGVVAVAALDASW